MRFDRIPIDCFVTITILLTRHLCHAQRKARIEYEYRTPKRESRVGVFSIDSETSNVGLYMNSLISFHLIITTNKKTTHFVVVHLYVCFVKLLVHSYSATLVVFKYHPRQQGYSSNSFNGIHLLFLHIWSIAHCIRRISNLLGMCWFFERWSKCVL